MFVGLAFLVVAAAAVGWALVHRHVGRNPSRPGSYAGGNGLLLIPVVGPRREVWWGEIQEFGVIGASGLGVVAVLRTGTGRGSADDRSDSRTRGLVPVPATACRCHVITETATPATDR